MLVTLNVQRQVAGLFVAEEQGARELKGVSALVQLFRIVRASGGGRRGGARALTPLIGREEELDLLRRHWDRARDGAGQLTLIVGEPGIGKSRLVEESRATLGETSHTFVELSSSQLLQNTPLHPIAEWGRQRFGVNEPADRPRRPREHSGSDRSGPNRIRAVARADGRRSIARGARRETRARGIAPAAIGGPCRVVSRRGALAAQSRSRSRTCIGPIRPRLISCRLSPSGARRHRC